MKDLFGQEVEVGDEVAVTPKNYRGMVKATIAKITPRGIRVEYMNTWNYSGEGRLEDYFVAAPGFVKSPIISTTSICKGCGGSGTKIYSSTATWRGGIGGQAMTKDVCNRCWGTGDDTKPGVKPTR